MISNINRLPGVVSSTASAMTQDIGPAKTVESISELKQYVVKYYDANGESHVDVLHRVGDQYFANPRGEEWCSLLGPVVPWLRDTVHKRISAKETPETVASLPSTDSVDVMGSRMAKSAGQP